MESQVGSDEVYIWMGLGTREGRGTDRELWGKGGEVDRGMTRVPNSQCTHGNLASPTLPTVAHCLVLFHHCTCRHIEDRSASRTRGCFDSLRNLCQTPGDLPPLPTA